MTKIVHTNFKKILLTLAVVLSVYFVYAGFDYSPFDYQVRTVKCYPNPATSVINFEFANTDKTNTLQIFSFTGKKMTEQQPLSSSKITITLGNDFYRGIYIFQLRDKTGRLIESGKFQVVK